LYDTEGTDVDASQQLALQTNNADAKRPSLCSPCPDTSPQLTSNPPSANTSGTNNTAFVSLDYSSKSTAPSTLTSMTSPFDSGSMILPPSDVYRAGTVRNGGGVMDVHVRPKATSAVFVCALQVALRPPEESPWDALVKVERQMESIVASDSVDVFVLPELAPIGYSEDTFSKYLPINATNQAMYQEFDRFFQVFARKFNTYICYGTIGWSYENRSIAMVRLGVPRLFIRQIVVDRLGTQVACYDKTYLCNYGDCAESRYFQPGPASVPTSFPVYSRDRSSVYRFGLLICADMRYPNLARTLTADPDHSVDCILQPSAFIRDCSFRTWSSFRETRAVENSIFWIGINYAGMNYGETSIVPPFVDDDHEPISLECEEGYVIGRVARDTLDHARSQFPFYQNLKLEESMKLRN
jgi:predicted amidohydrolase